MYGMMKKQIILLVKKKNIHILEKQEHVKSHNVPILNQKSQELVISQEQINQLQLSITQDLLLLLLIMNLSCITNLELQVNVILKKLLMPSLLKVTKRMIIGQSETLGVQIGVIKDISKLNMENVLRSPNMVNNQKSIHLHKILPTLIGIHLKITVKM